jgi:hypothetical protein
MLTEGEVEQLKKNGSPGVLVYSWCASICKKAYKEGELSADQEAALMRNISTVRGLGAKQIAYTLKQMPLAYFHLMALCINSFALCSSWTAAHNFSREHLTGCMNNAAYGAYTAPVVTPEYKFTNPADSTPGRIWEKPGTGVEYSAAPGPEIPKCYSAMVTRSPCARRGSSSSSARCTGWRCGCPIQWVRTRAATTSATTWRTSGTRA